MLNALEQRIIELSYKHQLTHVSSCLNVINLLDWIYDQRKDDDPVVLDSAHASCALYVVLEKHGICDAQEMVEKHGTHCSRDMEHGIWVSGGSLGQAATVSVGFALADKNRTVWLVTSDGSCMEGATREALRVGAKFCPNLRIHIVFNGFSAYGKITHGDLPTEGQIYYVDQERYPEFLRGLPGHYLKLSKEDYEELMA